MLVMNFQYNIFFFFKNLSLTNTISFLKYDHPSFNLTILCRDYFL